MRFRPPPPTYRLTAATYKLLAFFWSQSEPLGYEIILKLYFWEAAVYR